MNKKQERLLVAIARVVLARQPEGGYSHPAYVELREATDSITARPSRILRRGGSPKRKT